MSRILRRTAQVLGATLLACALVAPGAAVSIDDPSDRTAEAFPGGLTDPQPVVRSSTGLRCTIVGTRGPDVLRGTPRRDVICGLGGQDRIKGRGGDDIIEGGAGGDVVRGNRGDDDLSGGSGGDDIDGGPGFNVCDEPGDATDHPVRCVVDVDKPVAASVTPAPTTVDVSSAPQSMLIEAHVTDDTGVTRVQIGSKAASLVSGTSRDGTWAAAIRVPRYITPGPKDISVVVRDRVGRTGEATFPSVYAVLNTVVDQEMPILESMSLSETEVDVRSSPVPMTATVRVTDDLAGATDLFLCPAHAFPSGTPSFRQAGGCVLMKHSSGSPTDSTWTGTYIVPEDAPSGTWNFFVLINDASGNAPNDFWYGPDQLAAIGPTNEPRYRAIPEGGGVFMVQGTPQDLNAPVLTALHLSPTPVDTSRGAVTVTADIEATDIEGITSARLFISGYAGYPNNPSWVDLVDIARVESFELVTGTPRAGEWRATFVVPGGTPDGEYFIGVALEDSSHLENWVSPDSGRTTGAHVLTPTLSPTGVRFVVANS